MVINITAELKIHANEYKICLSRWRQW